MWPTRIYAPDFVPHGLLEPGDEIEHPFGFKAIVLDYFIIVEKDIITPQLTLIGRDSNIEVRNGFVSNIKIYNGSIIALDGSLVCGNRIYNGGILTHGDYSVIRDNFISCE